MFGTFTRPQGNDSPAEEAQTAIDDESVETTEVETESETVKEDEDQSDQTSTVEDDDSDDESQQDDDDKTEDVKKPKKGFERRIERFNQKLSAKDQEIEYWKKAALGGTKDEVQPVQSKPEGKPTYDQYNDMELFTEALTDWKVEQALSGMKQKTQQESVVQSYETKLSEFKKTTPDFEDVMNEFIEDYGDKPVPEIVQTVFESDVGPQLAYYLAKNTPDVERIAALPPHRRLIELGKIEDRMLRDSTPVKDKTTETKKVSKASPPADSVKTPGKVETRSLYDDDLPYYEWVKLREKKK